MEDKIARTTKSFLKEFFGIDVSDSALAILLIILGILFMIFPQLIGYILGILLIVAGILLVVKKS